MSKVTLAMPSGIGDVSWALSRLWSVRDQIACVEIADGYPRRTHQLFDLLPEWHHKYEQHFYQMILGFEAANGMSVDNGDDPRWSTVRDAGYERFMLEPNRWLELGRPLAGWLSDIPPDDTYYHYPMVVTDDHRARAHKLLAPAKASGKPTIGISCASYRGSEAWRTWGRAEWTACLERLIAEGWHPVLVGGTWDDLTSAVYDTLVDAHGDDVVTSVVARTHYGEVVEMLRVFDAYLGYSSGLNVTRTVLNRPTMALWPQCDVVDQGALSTSWAPPHMQEWETGRYVARTWRPLDDVWPTIKRFLRTCSDEIGRTLEPPCK